MKTGSFSTVPETLKYMEGQVNCVHVFCFQSVPQRRLPLQYEELKDYEYRADQSGFRENRISTLHVKLMQGESKFLNIYTTSEKAVPVFNICRSNSYFEEFRLIGNQTAMRPFLCHIPVARM